MKKYIVSAVLLLCTVLVLAGCGQKNKQISPKPPDPTETAQSGEAAEKYQNGIYRGFYYRGDLEAIAVQFELHEEQFQSVNLRGLKYKDGNYLSADATDIQHQIADQYRQAGAYLVGKGPAAIKDLLNPQGIAPDMDAVTSATLNTDKLAAALEDGLARNVFKPTEEPVTLLTGDYPDGVFYGSYDDGGVEQIAVAVTVKDNQFVSVKYEALNYGKNNYLEENASETMKAVASQYREAADYLEGKRLSALADLYEPNCLVADCDAVTGPTLRTNKLISAINDALESGE